MEKKVEGTVATAKARDDHNTNYYRATNVSQFQNMCESIVAEYVSSASKQSNSPVKNNSSALELVGSSECRISNSGRSNSTTVCSKARNKRFNSYRRKQNKRWLEKMSTEGPKSERYNEEVQLNELFSSLSVTRSSPERNILPKPRKCINCLNGLNNWSRRATRVNNRPLKMELTIEEKSGMGANKCSNVATKDEKEFHELCAVLSAVSIRSASERNTQNSPKPRRLNTSHRASFSNIQVDGAEKPRDATVHIHKEVIETMECLLSNVESECAHSFRFRDLCTDLHSAKMSPKVQITEVPEPIVWRVSQVFQNHTLRNHWYPPTAKRRTNTIDLRKVIAAKRLAFYLHEAMIKNPDTDGIHVLLRDKALTPHRND